MGVVREGCAWCGCEALEQLGSGWWFSFGGDMMGGLLEWLDAWSGDGGRNWCGAMVFV